jgi:WD40 repeat protein
MRIILLVLLLNCPTLCFGQFATNGPNVLAWGLNADGQTNVPPDLTNAVAITAGLSLSVALLPNGTVRAWGRNTSGQSNVPPDLTNVMAVAASAADGHVLALLSNRTVRAWGNNDNGQCNVPPDLTNVVIVIGGASQSFAIKSDGTIRLWGFTGNGIPPELTNVVGLACGGSHTLALKSDGSVRAWGDNEYGQGVTPPDVTNVVAVAACYNSSMAIRADGTVRVWGQAGTNVPPDATNCVAGAVGNYHYLALRADGKLFAWGDNQVGEINLPYGLANVRKIAAGDYHSLALVDPGTAPIPPPVLLGPPVPNSLNAPIGSTAAFSIIVDGTPPFWYQWYYNATNALTAATNKSLILANLVTEQTGNYHVVVSNYSGSVTSAPAVLNVIPVIAVSMVPALELVGQVGRQYRIDYINAVGPTGAWNPLATLTITNNPQNYFDLTAKGQPARYYRLIQLP